LQEALVTEDRTLAAMAAITGRSETTIRKHIDKVGHVSGHILVDRYIQAIFGWGHGVEPCRPSATLRRLEQLQLKMAEAFFEGGMAHDFWLRPRRPSIEAARSAYKKLPGFAVKRWDRQQGRPSGATEDTGDNDWDGLL
jgi:hypothetical protein